jgi:septum formation protein
MSERLRAVSLASASPRRLNLLESLGLRVDVVRTTYEEKEHDRGAVEPAPDKALRHAIGKADGAQSGGPPLVVAADTIVDVGDVVFGKPANAAEARSMLRTLSNRWHVVHTGFAVVDRVRAARATGVESTSVRFVTLDDAEIDRYVASGEPLDKAGGYGIQGRGALLVERIDGDFYTVMGLPLARLAAACRELGYEIL